MNLRPFKVVLLAATLAACGSKHDKSGTGKDPASQGRPNPTPVPTGTPSLTTGIEAPTFYSAPGLARVEFPTVDRKKVVDAMARAKQDNKIVIVNVTAAWCSPCQQFKKLRETDTNLKAAIDATEFVRLEYYEAERLFAEDYVPAPTPFFPSLFLFNPQTETWSFAAASQVTLPDAIRALKERNSIGDASRDEFRQRLAAGEKIGEGDADKLEAYRRVPAAYALEGRRDDALAFIEEFRKAVADYPAQFSGVSFEPGSDADFDLNLALSMLLARSSITLEEVKQRFPWAFSDLGTEVYTATNVLFRDPLFSVLQKEGVTSAAKVCRKLVAEVNQAVPLAADASEEQKINYRHYEKDREAKCVLLDAKSGRMSLDDIKNFVETSYAAAVDSRDKNPPSNGEGVDVEILARILTSTGGLFERAAELLQNEKDYLHTSRAATFEERKKTLADFEAQGNTVEAEKQKKKNENFERVSRALDDALDLVVSTLQAGIVHPYLKP